MHPFHKMGQCEVICTSEQWRSTNQETDPTTGLIVTDRGCTDLTQCRTNACRAMPSYTDAQVPSQTVGYTYSWTMTPTAAMTAMDRWCEYQCTRPIPYCPAAMCECPGAQWEKTAPLASGSAGAHWDADRDCRDHYQCSPDFTETVAPTSTSDRECVSCASLSCPTSPAQQQRAGEQESRRRGAALAHATQIKRAAEGARLELSAFERAHDAGAGGLRGRARMADEEYDD